MKPKQQREEVVFNGKLYARFPKSNSLSRRRYFYEYPKGRALHQAVWEDANGPILKGMHVHHVDGDSGNNDLSNLELLTPQEHNKRHGNKSPAQVAHFNRIKILAAEWHGSEEGRKWHSELGKMTWVNRRTEVKTCIVCEKEYVSKSLRGNEKYCSSKCGQKWHFDNKTYFTPSNCIICDKVYLKPPSTKARTCSLSCGAKWRWVGRREKAAAV